MKVAVYLDTDCNGKYLLDGSGNNITAGWYLLDWPNGQLGEAQEQIPFEHEIDALAAAAQGR